MKFQCLREDLSVLSLLDSIVQETPIITTLGSFKIEADKDGETIAITSTNLETTITAYIPANIFEGGNACVPKRLAALVKELTGDVVKFNLGNKLSVTCGSAKSTLPTLDVDDFPLAGVMSNDYQISVDAAALRNALDIAQTSAATKGVSPTILKGVCLSFKGNVLTAVGADGVRASLSTIPILDSIVDKIELTIPVTSVKSLIAALKDKEHASVVFGKDYSGQVNKVMVNCNSVNVTSQVFSGKFPDWTMLIPTQMASVVSVNPDELERALKIVKVTADKNDHVVFQFSTNGELHLSSDMGQGVDGEVIIKAELVSGEKRIEAIGVSPTYLLSALKCFGDVDKVDIGVNGPNGMIRLTAENTTTMALLMPMSI